MNINNNKHKDNKSRLKRLPLVACALLFSLFYSLSISADALLDIDGSKDKHILPEIKQQGYQDASIDTENFEIIAYTGIYNIEGFDSRAIFGVNGSLHINKVFFLNIDYGSSTLTGRYNISDLTTAVDESIVRYDAGIGINLLRGQAFRRKGHAINNQLYIKYSLGEIDVNAIRSDYSSLGMGLRLLHPNDKASLQIGFNKDSIKDSIGVQANSSTRSGLKYFIGLGIYF